MRAKKEFHRPIRECRHKYTGAGIYNAMDITLSFAEIRCKEVVNITDGKRLGRPVDLVFNARACVEGIVTPAPRRGWMRKDEDILIPWNAIVKIGDDVILVNLGPNPPPPPPPPPPEAIVPPPPMPY